MPDICLGSHQWRSQKFSMGGYGEDLGVELYPPRAIGDLSRLEARECAGQFLQFFNKNNAFIRIFRLKQCYF